MVIKPTFTPEEAEERKQINSRIDSFIANDMLNVTATKEATDVLWKRLWEIQLQAEKRYIDELSRSSEDIMDTLNDTLNGITKEYFLKYVDRQRKTFDPYLEKFSNAMKTGTLPKGANIPELRKMLKNDKAYIQQNFKHNFISAYQFIKGQCEPIISACNAHDYKFSEDPIKEKVALRIRLKADSFFKCRIEDFNEDDYPWADAFSYPSLDPERSNGETEGKTKELIPKFSQPDKSFMPNDNFGKSIYDGKMKQMGQEIEVVMSRKGKYVSTTSYTLSLDDGRKYEKYTPFDSCVSDAVTSIFLAGNRYFSPFQVYRTMNGMEDSQDVRSASIEAIEKSIEKQWTTLIDIDPRGSYYGKDFKDTIKSHLFNLEIFQRKYRTDGTRYTIYHILTVPITYRHALELGQVISVTNDYLSIYETTEEKKKGKVGYKVLDTRVYSTQERQCIKKYLISRIEGMRNERNNLSQKTILCDQLYKCAGYENPTKENKRNVREYVRQVLQYYQAIGKIKRFEFIKDKKTIHSVKISL